MNKESPIIVLSTSRSGLTDRPVIREGSNTLGPERFLIWPDVKLMGKVVKIQIEHYIRPFKSNGSCKILNEVNQQIYFASDQELLICEPFCLILPDSSYFSVRRTNDKERIIDT